MVVHLYWSTCFFKCVVLSKVKIFQIDFKMDLKWLWDKRKKQKKNENTLSSWLWPEGPTPFPFFSPTGAQLPFPPSSHLGQARYPSISAQQVDAAGLIRALPLFFPPPAQAASPFLWQSPPSGPRTSATLPPLLSSSSRIRPEYFPRNNWSP